MVRNHRHDHADHGHLEHTSRAGIGAYNRNAALPTLCTASVVDLAPTVLEALGMQARSTEQQYPAEMKGQSLKNGMERILRASDTRHEVLCCPP
jgi:arylsulfatase A-like enzyme